MIIKQKTYVGWNFNDVIQWVDKHYSKVCDLEFLKLYLDVRLQTRLPFEKLMEYISNCVGIDTTQYLNKKEFFKNYYNDCIKTWEDYCIKSQDIIVPFVIKLKKENCKYLVTSYSGQISKILPDYLKITKITGVKNTASEFIVTANDEVKYFEELDQIEFDIIITDPSIAMKETCE